MSTAEWVRQVLRAALRGEPGGEPRKKLAAVRAAARNSFPAAGIGEMLAEIERGYLDGTEPWPWLLPIG